MAPRKKQETKIKLYNTGDGISKEDMQYIFKRFYKADKSRSKNKDGTGIGLFIAKDILLKHGKNITVQSKEGEYALFEFSLNSAKR